MYLSFHFQDPVTQSCILLLLRCWNSATKLFTAIIWSADVTATEQGKWCDYFYWSTAYFITLCQLQSFCSAKWWEFRNLWVRRRHGLFKCPIQIFGKKNARIFSCSKVSWQRFQPILSPKDGWRRVEEQPVNCGNPPAGLRQYFLDACQTLYRWAKASKIKTDVFSSLLSHVTTGGALAALTWRHERSPTVTLSITGWGRNVGQLIILEMNSEVLCQGSAEVAIHWILQSAEPHANSGLLLTPQ